MIYSYDLVVCDRCGTEYPEDRGFGCPSCRKLETDSRGYYESTNRVDTVCYEVITYDGRIYMDWDTLVCSIEESNKITVTDRFIKWMFKKLESGMTVPLGNSDRHTTEETLEDGGYLITKVKAPKKELSDEVFNFY